MSGKLNLAVVSLSLGLGLSTLYSLCVLFDLAIPRYAMYRVWGALLPGFTWLTPFSFLLGLIESFIFGSVFIGLLFGVLYNLILTRTKMQLTSTPG